jgi:hypothetical protein
LYRHNSRTLWSNASASIYSKNGALEVGGVKLRNMGDFQFVFPNQKRGTRDTIEADEDFVPIRGIHCEVRRNACAVSSDSSPLRRSLLASVIW